MQQRDTPQTIHRLFRHRADAVAADFRPVLQDTSQRKHLHQYERGLRRAGQGAAAGSGGRPHHGRTDLPQHGTERGLGRTPDSEDKPESQHHRQPFRPGGVQRGVVQAEHHGRTGVRHAQQHAAHTGRETDPPRTGLRLHTNGRQHRPRRRLQGKVVHRETRPGVCQDFHGERRISVEHGAFPEQHPLHGHVHVQVSACRFAHARPRQPQRQL